jgi:protein ImuA
VAEVLAVSAPVADRNALLQTLQQQVRQLEKSRISEQTAVCSTGCEAFNRLLPAGGWQPGMLVEWFTSYSGGGAMTLAVALAREAAKSGGLIVLSDPRKQFYAPAAVALGFDPAQLVILQPPSPAEEMWALDQALRCEGVALVWAALNKLDDHDFRRLQLATEAGGTLGFLGRPARARGQPAWSDMQFLVEPQASAAGNRRLRVEVVRLRGGVAGASVMLEIDDITGQVREASVQHETHPLPEIPRLAPATPRRRQA